MFYVGFSVAPMSVVAPISALASALLPLGVAVAQGERPGPLVIAGGVICLLAVVLVPGEKMRWLQRIGLVLAGAGLVLVTI